MRPLLPLSLLLALSAAPAAQALTEAEQAAVTQRAPTAEETGRWRASCPLDLSGTEPVDLALDRPARRVPGSEFRLLMLITVASAPTTDGSELRRFDDLPHGGIGGPDICEAVTMTRFPPHAPGKTVTIFGLRLRPDLDLAKDYPTAAVEIARRKQLLVIIPQTFAAIPLAEGETGTELAAQAAASPLVRTDRPYFILQRTLMLPLRN